ncbi:hypothetical protein PVAP13_4NG314500 [Panicum virgatum]|uniref:Uncharacterized protein n=1 Tax=Panicum virgatum TaxID=38727 RepID=A0A8T0TDJ9_PANVG|nr:hypothetical protein PVAP13_4NG314500 [Panicum virgatum]
MEDFRAVRRYIHPCRHHCFFLNTSFSLYDFCNMLYVQSAVEGTAPPSPRPCTPSTSLSLTPGFLPTIIPYQILCAATFPFTHGGTPLARFMAGSRCWNRGSMDDHRTRGTHKDFRRRTPVFWPVIHSSLLGSNRKKCIHGCFIAAAPGN